MDQHKGDMNRVLLLLCVSYCCCCCRCCCRCCSAAVACCLCSSSYSCHPKYYSYKQQYLLAVNVRYCQLNTPLAIQSILRPRLTYEYLIPIMVITGTRGAAGGRQPAAAKRRSPLAYYITRTAVPGSLVPL